jgi:hypothetical protein
VNWKPMLNAPKDGKDILLRFDNWGGSSVVVQGCWFSSPKEIDDGWETPFGSIGEPDAWMDLPAAAADSAIQR